MQHGPKQPPAGGSCVHNLHSLHGGANGSVSSGSACSYQGFFLLASQQISSSRNLNGGRERGETPEIGVLRGSDPLRQLKPPVWTAVGQIPRVLDRIQPPTGHAVQVPHRMADRTRSWMAPHLTPRCRESNRVAPAAVRQHDEAIAVPGAVGRGSQGTLRRSDVVVDPGIGLCGRRTG
jgi:hypothetical protein